jgi:hypothetical protein
MRKLKESIFIFKAYYYYALLLLSHGAYGLITKQDEFVLGEAMDSSLSFFSSTANPSNNTLCTHNIRELMIRNGIVPSASSLRNNLTDAQLMRLGILASIALISPWNQDAQGKFFITDRGILVEDYHPSSSESDIMLCIVCVLLSIIVLFHVTSAQHHYVLAPPPPNPNGDTAAKPS